MPNDAKITTQQPEIAMSEIPVYYVKSNFYRVIHADGVYGGGTPTPGNIMMTIFSHRIAFPEKIVNDSFGNEIPGKRVVKSGFENELEVSVVMDLATAKVMYQWLDNVIKNTEAILRQPQK